MPKRAHTREPLGSIIKQITALLLAGLMMTQMEFGLAQTPSAVIVPNAYKQFSDLNGKPLANGTVYYYVPGTTTPKLTWQDPYQNTINSNPVTLNGSGEALVWGSGIYREVVYDINSNLIWDQLTGGYNCVGSGGLPMGANGALQYNNNGVFGGLPLGTSSQVLLGNASGAPTWGSAPPTSVGSITGLGTGVATALGLPVTGTGDIVLQNTPTINNPAINSPTIGNPTISGGTWNNPTLTGTVTMPGGSNTFATITLTGATPSSTPSGTISYGNTLAAPGLCGGYPYLGNTGCFVISIPSLGWAYIPYFN